MKRNLLSSLLLVGAIAFTLNSCKKTEPDTETQSAVDNSICDGELTRMVHTTNSFGINEQGVKSLTTTASGSPTIILPDTVAHPGWPRTLIIDYGTVGIVDSIDHKTRKGQIICSFSNYWHVIGSAMKVTLSGYTVNNMTITLDSIKLTHSAANSVTHTVYNAVCTSPTWSLSWACTRTLTQTEGMSTPLNFYDDAFSFTGSANGKNRDGKTYTVSITTPIVKRASCSWIESGKIDITPDGLATRTVDFGTGTCDNQASLIINGNTFTFSMN